MEKTMEIKGMMWTLRGNRKESTGGTATGRGSDRQPRKRNCSCKAECRDRR